METNNPNNSVPSAEGGEERRPKRQRIGESGEGQQPQRYHSYNNDGDPREGGYQPRQGGYQQRQGGYQPRQGGYQPRQGGYQPRQGGYQQRDGGYGQPRQGGYQQYNRQPREGGYQPNDGQGGYQPRQGGYQQRQGGYGQPRQGGYNRPQHGSQFRQYGQPRQQQPREGQEGMMDNQQYQPEGGYQPRQGGYQQRQGGHQQRQGGYNNQNRRPGGNRQGGYQQGGNRRFNQNGMPQGGKSFVPRPKPVIYDVPETDPDAEIRLNKYMANAGICSRREADDFIRQGLVKVNGQPVTELGTKITAKDTVEYDDKIVALERKCYILLNKPKDCVTTSEDPNGRLTVMDVVKGACNERIYPVGRLDRNTTGVLLLTNDGDLASKLTHPKFVKKKIYHVWTDKDVTEEDMQRIADGIELDDGTIHADAISYATDTDRNQVGIEIHSGRNRIVRRIFESLGYHVTKLDRVYFAGLTKKNLPRGRWRYLTQEEVNYLKMGSFD